MAIKSKASDRASTTKSADDFIIELEAGLRINEHELDGALQEQPELFYHVAKELALMISQRDQAKQHLAEIEAEVVVALNEKARANDEKVTVKEIESLKDTDEDVLAAAKNFYQLSAMVGKLGALKEAYVQRSYVLKDMVTLYVNNYYGSGDGMQQTREQSKNQVRDQVKEAAKNLYRKS